MLEMKYLVSVIVPVYKVEKYIYQCVDSIISQTYSNLEIILIDDGSPDRCPAICDEYVKKDNRIKVVHKQNGGLSSARNAGIDFASGDFITFVDSDDYLADNYVEKMYLALINNNVDMCFCKKNLVYEKDKDKIEIIASKEKCLKNNENFIVDYNYFLNHYFLCKRRIIMKKIFKGFVTLALCATLGVAATSFASCGDPNTIKIGASPTPHAEILKEAVAEELKKDGYKLKVVEYLDYVQPNNALEAGDLDANYFQHNIYLKDFNETHNTHLTAVANVHYEAFGIYRGKYSEGELSDIPNNAKVLVPNDGTNEARALFLLQAANLITLKEGVTYSKATKNDIESNPKNLQITEIESAQIPISLSDAAIGVVNGNYALQHNLSAAIQYENIPETEQEQYVNVVAVKSGNEESEKTKALKKAILSDAVKTYIQQKYNGSVICVF